MKTAKHMIALAMASVLGVALAQSDWSVYAAQGTKKEELSESYRGSQKNNIGRYVAKIRTIVPRERTT